VDQSDERKARSAEMMFLRSVAGFTLLDFMRSTEKLNQSNIYNLNEERVNSSVDYEIISNKMQ
jgi:hypothetical protein